MKPTGTSLTEGANMTEEVNSTSPVSDEQATAQTTPPPEAPVVDPVYAVEAQVAEQQKQLRSLDDLDPEARRLAEAHASRAVNEALRNKQEKGDFISRAEMDRVLEQERNSVINEMAARDTARDTLYEYLHGHGIAPGTPAYSEFAQASQLFKPEQLMTAEGVAAIVRSMPSQHNADSQVMPGAGTGSSRIQDLVASSSMGALGAKAGESDISTRAHELLQEAHKQKRI
tara:strand:+ start:30 stop:716 length:687 start_codon:yes stop_codon:yes gene_type:complete